MKTKTKRIYLLIFALVTMLTGAKADPAFPYAYIENDSILCFTVGTLPETNAWEVSNTGTEQPWNVLRFKIKVVRFMDEFSSARPLSCRDWFKHMTSLHKIEGIENLNTSSVTDMSNMFYGCELLTSLDLSGFNTSSVTDMGGMFCLCKSLKSLDLRNFDTSNVTDMINMFYGCEQLTSLDLSSFNTSSVTDMSYMFYQCYSLTSLNVSSFNTSNVKKMFGMFFYCESLLNLDLRSFNTSNVTDMRQMFWYCSSLTTIYCNDDWQRINLVSGDMFKGCYVLSGALEYSTVISMTDAKYANPETGYFTRVDTFDIKLAETSITTINSKDLTVIPGVTGKASYDNKTKTLYLENASITEMTMAGGYAIDNGIDSLTINVTGDCSISSAAGIGIKNISKTLIITGTGTLDITAGNNGIVMTNTNPNNLVIDGNVTVNVTADNYGVQGREYTPRVVSGTAKTYYRTTLKVGGVNSKLSVNGTKQCFYTLGGFTPADGYEVTSPSRTAFDPASNTFCRVVATTSGSGKIGTGTLVLTLVPVAGTAVVIEKPVTYQIGDVNHDGEITMADANMVVNYYLATTKPSDFDKTLADVNGDDDITMADANMIVNMFLNGDNGGQTTEDTDTKTAIDLGLNVKWAACNVGASEAWDYGDYFAWGETTGHATGTYVFDWSSYKFKSGTFMTKYVFSWVDNTVYNDYPVLQPEDDAAAVNWGGTWRMPTEEELSDLWKNCQWTWLPVGNDKYNGVAGYKVTGPNGNSIFIPHAGYYDGGEKKDITVLWSSTLTAGNDERAQILWFGSSAVSCNNNYADRYKGASVRPVCP